MIPKILHFIWWQGWTHVPPLFRHNVTVWQKHNPEYEIKLWDESKLLQLCHQYFPQYETDFRQTRYMIEQIDLSKFMLMEAIGGFYVDTDIESHRAIPSDWLTYRAVMSQMYVQDVDFKEFSVLASTMSLGYSWHHIYNNGFFGGEPGSQLYRSILDEAMALHSTIPHWLGKQIHVMYTSGPSFLTIYIKRNNLDQDPTVKLLDPQMIEGCGTHYAMSHDTRDCLLTSQTIGIHKHELSWASPIHFWFIKVLYHRKFIGCCILIWLGLFLLGLLIGSYCKY